MLIMGAIMITMAGIGYFYYKDTQATIGTLRSNLATAEVAVDLAQAEIKTLNENQVKQAKLIGELNQKIHLASADIDALRKMFRKHDLSNLALKKSQLVEKIINKATMKIFKELEDETKAPK
jgi:hypothetical protein